jgi:hypothetical protein
MSRDNTQGGCNARLSESGHVDGMYFLHDAQSQVVFSDWAQALRETPERHDRTDAVHVAGHLAVGIRKTTVLFQARVQLHQLTVLLCVQISSEKTRIQHELTDSVDTMDCGDHGEPRESGGRGSESQ